MIDEKPTCGNCGKVMTSENSQIVPEYFLCDSCVPEMKDPAVRKILSSAIEQMNDRKPNTQLAEQVAELKKERDVWQGRYRAAYNLACDKDEQIAALKAFHRNLCKRFGYFHDEQDWRRDLASLEEHIAQQIAALKGELADSSEQLLFANIRGDTAKTLLSGLVEALKLNLTAEQLEFLTGDPRAKAALAGAEGKA